MIEAISVTYLISIGILLIGLEALIFSFVLFFLGVGFILVGIVSNFYLFDNGIVQIATAFVLALAFAYIFRNNLLARMSKVSSKREERAHVSGVGILIDGAIKFDGTYWNTQSDLSEYEEGDKVTIIDVVDNMVVLK